MSTSTICASFIGGAACATLGAFAVTRVSQSDAADPTGNPKAANTPGRIPHAAVDPLEEFREGEFYEVVLSHYYETGTCKGDYSNGSLKEGSALAHTREEAQALVDKFYETGEITVFVCRKRYIDDVLSPEQETIRFLSADPKKNEKGLQYKKTARTFTSSRDSYNYRFFYSAVIRKHENASGVLFEIAATIPTKTIVVNTPKGEFAVAWTKEQVKIRGPDYKLDYTRGDPSKESAPSRVHSRESLAEIIWSILDGSAAADPARAT